MNFFETLKHLSSHSRLESHQTMEAPSKRSPLLSPPLPPPPPSSSSCFFSLIIRASDVALFPRPLSTVSSPRRLCFFSTALSVHYDPGARH